MKDTEFDKLINGLDQYKDCSYCIHYWSWLGKVRCTLPGGEHYKPEAICPKFEEV